MRNAVWSALFALIVSALALTAADALAQQGDHGVRDGPPAEDAVTDTERGLPDTDTRDEFEQAMEEAARDSTLCTNEDALAGRCMVVARLPRCPGDPRCPDPTRARPDTETPQ